MIDRFTISAIIPALNEENAIATVVEGLRALRNKDGSAVIDNVVVCDNGSTDHTAKNAEQAGAIVVKESQPGYGRACLSALAVMPHNTDIVLFVDGDDSCFIEQAMPLLNGIVAGYDITIGSRTLGKIERGALTLPQRFGNWLAAKLIDWLWNEKISDLGPFRAIRAEALQTLCMQDEQFGWTVEMQIKAIQKGLLMNEYPVDSKVRVGQSKISGTVLGTLGAAKGILGMIFTLRLRQSSFYNSTIRQQ